MASEKAARTCNQYLQFFLPVLLFDDSHIRDGHSELPTPISDVLVLFNDFLRYIPRKNKNCVRTNFSE
jgi:hypothetical protein